MGTPGKATSGEELNKPLTSVQILLLLYTICTMYITCMLLKLGMFTLTLSFSFLLPFSLGGQLLTERVGS